MSSFEAFFEDMGPRPSHDHSLERKDNDGPYSPENCIWAIRLVQCNNKRNNRELTANGITDTIAGWSRRQGWRKHVIQNRLVAGWSDHNAVNTPVAPRAQGVS